jgi:hypothetical protein
MRNSMLLRSNFCQVNNHRNLSVENFAGEGLAIGSCPLAGGNVNRFGQTEGEPTAFFEADHGGGGFTLWTLDLGSISLRSFSLRGMALQNTGIASVAAYEKAGGLNRQVHACQVDRIKRQPHIAAIAPEVRRLGRLHSTCDDSPARDQFVPFDHHGFVDDRLEGSVRTWILGGYRVHQPNREQGTGRQILGIVERKTRFRVRAVVLSRRSAAGTGWRPIPVMKRNFMLVGGSGTGVTLQPGRTGATRRPEQGQQHRPNRQTIQTMGSAEPAH